MVFLFNLVDDKSRKDKSFPIPHPKALDIASFDAQYPATLSIFIIFSLFCSSFVKSLFRKFFYKTLFKRPFSNPYLMPNLMVLVSPNFANKLRKF